MWDLWELFLPIWVTAAEVLLQTVNGALMHISPASAAVTTNSP
jgi:hypothetical protein